MTRSRTPFAVVALRVLAVAFAIGVVVWLVVDKQRRANPPGPEGAGTEGRTTPVAERGGGPESPSSPQPAAGPAGDLTTRPSPYLNSSKSLTVDAESLPILSAPDEAEPKGARPGDEKPTDAKPKEGATFLPSSKSGVIEPRR